MRFDAVLKRLIVGTLFLVAMGWAPRAHAQLAPGEWVRTDAQGKGLAMTVEPCCNGGLRLTYHLPAPAAGQPPINLTVDSPMDGTEVPAMVAGKPSGQTLAVTRVDARHYTAIVKMAGKPFSTSNATMSADGKTLTVESTLTAPGPDGKPQKIIETWARK
jgi:hypothetical protein